MATQYETLDDAAVTRLAQAALAHYPPALQGALRLLCRSENSTFTVDAGGTRYALRLHRGNYHDRAAVEGELHWLDALRADTGIVVPQAIADAAGRRVVTVADGHGGERHAAMFHWVAGEEPTNLVDPAAFRELGRLTARLHAHARAWQAPAGFRRILWTHETMVGPDGHWGSWRDLPGMTPADAAVIEAAARQVGAALDRYGTGPDRFGLIHADLRLTNLLLHEDGTRIIDFDDCGLGWYLHDAAAAISFEEHHPAAPEWLAEWIAGYETLAPLDAADRAVLPSLLIQRRIQLTAWIASHALTETARRLRPHWLADTVRLCRRYLAGDPWPVGAG